MKKKSYGRDYRHALSQTGKDFYPNDNNFKDSALNRSRFYNCSFNKISFYRAAVTGSVFENCKFIDCNLDFADFEFCDFSDCKIEIRQVQDCSFNNSNFTKCSIQNSKFGKCTFTNCFFDEVTLDKVDINFSTLESACFSKCTFENIDWRNLNLEFVEFINPHMTNVVLPSEQIPFMFGMLNYLDNTNDDVKISANNSIVSVNDYFKNEIPKLVNDFEKRGINLPISNICFFGRDKDYDKGLDFLIHEVNECAFCKDYRGIKFCCKLLSMGEIDERYLNKIYKYITSMGDSLEPQSTEMKNFSRNIGEIRNMLYSKRKLKFLLIRLKSNIGIESSERFANLINIFQNLAKPSHTEMLNVRFSLEYNSPLLIELKIEGDASLFSLVLRSFMIIADIPIHDCQNYPAVSALASQSGIHAHEDALRYAEKSLSELKKDGIKIALLEYRVEGCEAELKDGGKNFYMDSSLYDVTPRGLINVST